MENEAKPHDQAPLLPSAAAVVEDESQHVRTTVTRHSSRRHKAQMFIFVTFLAIVLLFSIGTSENKRFRWQKNATIREPSAILTPFHEQVALDPTLNVASTIQQHIETGQRVYQALLQRQSRTVEEAVSKFESKYVDRKAPRHFPAWVRFALQHASPLIDDFEQVEKNVEPFYAASATDLRKRMAETIAHEKERNQGWINITSGVITVHNGPYEWIQHMLDILHPLNKTTALPDLLLPLNWHDGPKAFARSTMWLQNANSVRSTLYGVKAKWNALTNACPGSVADADQSRDRPSVDVCTQDRSMQRQHALFTHGDTWISTLVPIASWTRLSTQSDLIVPHFCYGVKTFREGDGKIVEKPFDKRRESLYWRGSSTGGEPKQDTWRYGHRQRFVMLMQSSKKAIEEHVKGVKSISQSAVAAILGGGQVLNVLLRLKASMFDVSFSQYVYCDVDQKACDEMKTLMPIAPWTSSSAAFEHKYVFDIDGNSMSCRFYRLLGTDSLVFKQTIWNEWHDERVIPWVHYVPVSLEMTELPYLLDYFNNDPNGRRFARQIAHDGIRVTADALRTIDLTVYWYRIFVELADLLVRE